MNHSVSDSLERIRNWLKANAPHVVSYFKPGATDVQIVALEASMGISLPADLRELLSIHNGGAESGILPSSDGFDMMGFSPLNVEEIEYNYNMLKKLVNDGEFDGRTSDAEEGIRNDWWNASWIPFAGNGGGDYQCIDLNPTDEGTVGQIIGAWHDDSERQLIATSLKDYLCKLADSLESGEYQYDEEYGVVPVDE
jgi:molybdopterin molybdotransferase